VIYCGRTVSDRGSVQDCWCFVSPRVTDRDCVPIVRVEGPAGRCGQIGKILLNVRALTKEVV
jgi:hypothetical protein